MRAPRFANVAVLANPSAGARDASVKADALVTTLRASGRTAERMATARLGDSPEWRAHVERDVDLVVAVGGDGTLAGVLAHLPRRDIPVALLPSGTANVLAIDLDLPRDPERFVSSLENARIQPLDVALVCGRFLSFLVTGVGFDASVVREYERLKRSKKSADSSWRASKLTWIQAGIAAFAAHRPTSLRVEIDGSPVPGDVGHVLVSNCIHYGGFSILAADRVLDDGMYEVYLFRRRSRAGLLGYGLRGTVARFPGGSCERVRARHVRVSASEPVDFEIDGEHALDASPRWTTPVEIEVEPERCALVIP